MEVILDGVSILICGIGIFFFIISIIFYKKRKKEIIQKVIEQEQQSINNALAKLKIEYQTEVQNVKQLQEKADSTFAQINANVELIQKQKSEIQKILEDYQNSETQRIEKEISEWTTSAQEAADAYIQLILDENNKEKTSAALQLEELKKEIEDFRIRRESLNEAIRKEREMENLQDSHRIQLSDFDKEDIHFLVSLENKIHNKELLHKLIWTEYLQKPFNQMINRICGANVPKNVVYCIENIETHEKYIGKTSASYKDRMSNHIKASLGLGQLTRQQIHKALFGNWDKFMFSIIEEVGENQKLSDREKFYIETFQSNQYGYNMKV